MSVGADILLRMEHLSLPGITKLAGIITTGQLLSSGLARHQVRTLIRRGDLIALDYGVYATADSAGRLELLPNGPVILRAASALATAAPGSVISHHTAAQLHGLDLLGPPRSEVAITRPPGLGSKSGNPGVHVYTAKLPSSHVGARLAIPVTTVARTVIDLARNGDFRAGVVVADSALHQRLTSTNDLLRVLADCARSRGVRTAAEVVKFADLLAESPLESIGRVAFSDCGLPRRAPSRGAMQGGQLSHGLPIAAVLDRSRGRRCHEVRRSVPGYEAASPRCRSSRRRIRSRAFWLARNNVKAVASGWSDPCGLRTRQAPPRGYARPAA